MKANPIVPRAPLRKLASLYGIQTAYQDIFGRRKVASAQSLWAGLQALGASVNHPRDIADALRERQRQIWQSALEPAVVMWNGRPKEIEICLEAKRARGPARYCILTESGEEHRWNGNLEDLPTLQAGALDGKRFLFKRIRIGTRVASGYHRWQVHCRAGSFESLLISAPPRAYERTERAWGAFLPVYSLHSQSSWGAGDFSDLETLQRWVAELGGSVIATLPFLASFLDEPFDPSPYLPASRLFWNEFYVDPRKAEEFRECPAAQKLVNSSQWQRELHALRRLPRVDYRRQMALKRPVIEQMAGWLVEKKTARYGAFQEYVSTYPEVKDYAAFRAAGERLQAPWPEWPQRLRRGKLQEGDYDPHVMLYHLYAQWLAEQQVRSLAAKDSSGAAGLYLDFPLGVRPHSYDVWRERELFVLHASAGAPPDTFFTKGQNWGFPPLHPEAMRRNRYAYLLACLRHQFRHASLVRIDHVMGLHRLFWIPRGMEAKDGVYLRYRPEELYAILSLESHRSQTMVVGENLGTVPASVTRAMERHRVQQTYVLQYEAKPNRKRPLRLPPERSVASLNTHDMSPFAAFLRGRDLEELQELGLFDKTEASRQSRLRRKVCRALAKFLGGKRLRWGTAPAAEDLMRNCLEWLARSPAKLVLMNLEDLWLETAAQNVPGTSVERPNWQRKARYSLEQFTKLPQVLKTLRALNRLRSRSTGRTD